MSVATLGTAAFALNGNMVLQDINLRIERGEIVTIVGPNGSGKSTLLRILIGALAPTSGRVEGASRQIIGYVPQRLNIDVTLPMTVYRFLSLPRRQRRDDMEAALQQAGLSGLGRQPLMTLSGGQFQRVLLARALIEKPDLLLLDEATQGLDYSGSADFYRQIEQVRQTLGCAILMVSHELHTVMRTSDRVISLPIFAGVLVVSLLMALAVTTLSERGYTMDTLLGVLSHSSLAFGLVAVSFLSGIRIDLMAYLFGDILSVGTLDLGIIWGGAALVLILVSWRWSALLTSTLNADLACASGISPKREKMILTLSLAVVVAVAIKVVGVLLIAAMLIIPAATARPFSRTPETMAIVAAVIGGVASLAGLQASYVMDTPTGPTIVCIVAVLFGVSGVFRHIFRPQRTHA